MRSGHLMGYNALWALDALARAINWFSSGLQSVFRESIGSDRGFRVRFASHLIKIGASECVSRVNWGLQSAFRESIDSDRGFRVRFASQLGASERVS